MKKLLLMLLGVLIALPALARDFSYTYEGQTITYTVIDEEAKTCKTKDGAWSSAGNSVSGTMVLPSNPMDGDTEYTLTHIGEYAFRNCSGLISVTIPNSVTEIGYYAFYGCTGLTSVTIPNSVTAIGIYAFRDCSSLTEVTIPESVTTIGGSAFNGCSGLTEVTIPNSVTTISTGVFSHCSGLTEVTIPNSVTSIGNSALAYCTSLTSVTIPNSVTEIGYYAFYGCTGLTSVTIPNSVTKIGGSAFRDCSGLKSVYIPTSVTEIGEEAFDGCGLVKSAYPNTLSDPFSRGSRIAYNPEGAIIEDGIIYGAEKKEIFFAPLTLEGDFTIPESVTSIGDYAFEFCRGLEIVYFNAKNCAIGACAFYGTDIKAVSIGENVKTIPTQLTYLANIERGAFPSTMTNPFKSTVKTFAYSPDKMKLVRGCILDKSGAKLHFALWPKDEYTVPETVTEICDNAFANCTMMTAIELPSGLQVINDNTFSNCTGLTSVTLPSNLGNIGKNAFTGCSNLKEIYSTASPAPNFDITSFSDLYDTTTVNIPENLLGDYTNRYTNWSLFKNLHIGNSGISETLAADNFAYQHINNTDVRIVASEQYSQLTELTVPSTLQELVTPGDEDHDPVYKTLNVVEIGPGAFANLPNLTRATINEGIRTISTSTFKGCTALTEVNLPSTVTEIASSTFEGCSAFSSFNTAGEITKIGAAAFAGTALPEVSFPIATWIGDYAFADVTTLTQLESGVLLSFIGNKAFLNSGLTQLTFLGCNSLTIDDSAFALNANLTSVTLGEGVKSVGNNVFKDCGKLKTVTIGKDVERIGDSAFEGTVIGTLTFAKDGALKEIGNLAFSGVRARGTLDLPDALERIGDYAFQNPRMYTEIILPANRSLAIGKEAFAQAQRVTSIQFPETISSMGDGAFKDNAATELDVKCNNIGAEAFLGCNKLQKLTVTGAGTIGTRAFAELAELTEANIDIAEIGEYAFTAAPKLETVTLGDGVKIVGAKSFLNSAALSSVTFGLGLERLGQYALVGTKVTDISFPSAAEPDPAIIVDELGLTLHSLSLGNRAKEINSGLGFTTDCEIDFGTTVEKMKTITVYNPNLTLTLPGSLLEFGSYSINQINVANLNIPANPNNKELKINYLSSSSMLRPIYITNQLFIDRNVNTTSTMRDYFICQDLVFGETADAEITMSSHPQCKTLHVGASVKELGSIYSPNRLTFSEGIKTIRGIYTSPAVVKLPASLESVGPINSSYLEELIFADGPNPITIGSVYKKNLKSVYMGRDIATDGAFSDSPVLESLIIGDEVTTIGKQMFKNCSAMTSAVMSDNVSTIGEEAFYGCSGLDVLSISANVKEIGTNAYANCNNFSRIVARGTVPPEGNAGFGQDVEDNVPLYVPEEALDAYVDSDLFYPFYTIESFNDNVVEEITTEDTLDEEFTVGSQFNICDYIKVIIKFFGGKIKPHMAAPMYAGMMRAPSAATDYSDRLRWFSPNPHIASVDQNGNVTINGEGQAEIRAYVLDGSDRMLSIGVNQLTTGDLNNDGLIDAADLQILVNYVADGDKTSSRSDVNSDGEIDAADIQILINKITE